MVSDEGRLRQICLQDRVNMNVGVAHSDPNPNSTFFNSRGMWVTYIIIVGIVHYMLLSLPFLSVAGAWTLTNVLHNAVYNFTLLWIWVDLGFARGAVCRGYTQGFLYSSRVGGSLKFGLVRISPTSRRQKKFWPINLCLLSTLITIL